MPAPPTPTAESHARRERRPLDDAPVGQPLRLDRSSNVPAAAEEICFQGRAVSAVGQEGTS